MHWDFQCGCTISPTTSDTLWIPLWIPLWILTKSGHRRVATYRSVAGGSLPPPRVAQSQNPSLPDWANLRIHYIAASAVGKKANEQYLKYTSWACTYLYIYMYIYTYYTIYNIYYTHCIIYISDNITWHYISITTNHPLSATNTSSKHFSGANCWPQPCLGTPSPLTDAHRRRHAGSPHGSSVEAANHLAANLWVTCWETLGSTGNGTHMIHIWTMGTNMTSYIIIWTLWTNMT